MTMSSRVFIVLTLLAAGLLAACARNPEPRAGAESASSMGGDSGAAEPSFTAATGRVVNGGTDRFPVTSLVSDGGTATRLEGALLGELRALAGAELLARGVLGSTAGARSLDVREYEVLAVDGQRPRVGIVRARDGELWLTSSDTLRIVPALDELRELVGAKIWVLGTSDSHARELRVRSYGVIARAR